MSRGILLVFQQYLCIKIQTIFVKYLPQIRVHIFKFTLKLNLLNSQTISFILLTLNCCGLHFDQVIIIYVIFEMFYISINSQLNKNAYLVEVILCNIPLAPIISDYKGHKESLGSHKRTLKKTLSCIFECFISCFRAHFPIRLPNQHLKYFKKQT